MKKNNDLLRKAFEEAEIEYFDRVIKQTDVEWTPSKDFERRMNKLMHKPKQSCRNYRDYCKWVACIVLVFAILSSVVVNVEAIRSPFVEFFLKIYERFSDVFVQSKGKSDAPEHIETMFLPTAIPDGYGVKQRSEADTLILIIYTNANNLQIRFEQQILCNAHFALNTEDSQLYEIPVGAQIGQYFINNGFISLSWIAHDYAFCLSVPDCFTIEEAVQIAESLAPVEQ